MIVILLDCIESYKVIQTMNGLEVYDGDDFVCEMRGSFFQDFKDEWGKVDEDELLLAVYEEIELEKTMEVL